jgi:hypothetical protein
MRMTSSARCRDAVATTTPTATALRGARESCEPRGNGERCGAVFRAVARGAKDAPLAVMRRQIALVFAVVPLLACTTKDGSAAADAGDAGGAGDAADATDAADTGPTDAADAGDSGRAECPRAAPSVPCGALVCEGATPVCCAEDPTFACVSSSCPTFSDSDPTPYGVNESRCNDSKDCPSGTFCCSIYNKGLSRQERSCQAPTSGACYWVCNDDCDCPTGLCVGGACK